MLSSQSMKSVLTVFSIYFNSFQIYSILVMFTPIIWQIIALFCEIYFVLKEVHVSGHYLLKLGGA